MPSVRSSRATRPTIISKSSSPNLRCSSLSKSSAHGVEHIRHDRVELGKQHCVLARLVRAVHSDEPAVSTLRREFDDRVGKPPPGLMLLKEYVAKLDELPGLAKMRENLLLLENRFGRRGVP